MVHKVGCGGLGGTQHVHDVRACVLPACLLRAHGHVEIAIELE